MTDNPSQDYAELLRDVVYPAIEREKMQARKAQDAEAARRGFDPRLGRWYGAKPPMPHNAPLPKGAFRILPGRKY